MSAIVTLAFLQTFLRRTTASVEKVGAAFGAADLLVADTAAAAAERDAVDFDDEDEDEDDEKEDECDLGACAKGGG